MPLELNKDQIGEIIPSLRRFCREELEVELSEMRAGFLLDFIQKEIAPYAYNQGVRDSESYIRNKLEDLPATCFEEGLTYWTKKRK